jgi:pimeloyl-ACP methyl ester carboxylesterase
VSTATAGSVDPLRHRRVGELGERCFVTDRGNAPPRVLLFHDLMASSWDLRALELGLEGRRVSFDLLGYGSSDRPAVISIAAQVDLVERVLDAIPGGSGSTIAIGHGIGCAVAAELGRRRDRVQQVWISPRFGLRGSGPFPASEEALRAQLAGSVVSVEAWLDAGGERSLAIAWSHASIPGTDVTHQQWSAIARRTCAELYGGLQQAANGGGVVVVHGDDAREAEAAAEVGALARARLEQVEGTASAPHRERPGETLRVIRRVLQAGAAGASAAQA